MMLRVLKSLGLIAMLAGITGCDLTGPPSSGIALPEGNAERGKEAFVTLECTSCHKVKDLKLPEPETEGPVMVVLGGGVSRVKTYGELVTSIINPSHRLARGFPKAQISGDGESLMAVYNDVMTVTELIDLVAFLESEYEVIERPGYRYPVYTYDQTKK